ncbi:MAG: TIGR02186 family protein [Sphingopyxis sp.]
MVVTTPPATRRTPSPAGLFALVALLLCALLLVAPRPAGAQMRDPVLVPDVSSRAIDIKYSFTGENLLLFGAIIYPDGRAPDQRADIVVVIKGPTAPIRLREKQRIAGIWVNADSVRFATSPGYYAIAASRPIGDMVDERTAAIYELGLANLSLSPSGFDGEEQLRTFERGLVDLKQRQRLFAEASGTVEITRGALYRANLSIPAQVPVGRYTAETYLISRGRVLAVASRDIDIRKTGFDRFVEYAAQNYGFLYGLVAVALSLSLGWGAGWLFNRR